jgi:hypothetical protein
MVSYLLVRFLGFGGGFIGLRRSTLRMRRSNASGLGSVSGRFDEALALL